MKPWFKQSASFFTKLLISNVEPYCLLNFQLAHNFLWFLSTYPSHLSILFSWEIYQVTLEDCLSTSVKWDLNAFYLLRGWRPSPLLKTQILPVKEHSLIMPHPTLLHNFPFIFLLLLCIYFFFWGINIVPPYQEKLAICAFNCIHSYIFQNLVPLSTTYPNPIFLHISHIFISCMSTGFFSFIYKFSSSS